MNMRKKRLIGLVIITLLAVPPVHSQSRKIQEAVRKKEKTERSYERAYEKARKKTIRHRMKIQTKETKKYMKDSDKRARRYNKQGDPGFMERLFSKKRKKKR